MKIKVLFVTKGCDPVLYRYNIGWTNEQINRNIFEVDVVDCSNKDISDWIPKYDFIIYYRVLTPEHSCIDLARNLNKLVGYMNDDYLFEYPFGKSLYNLMDQSDFIITPTRLLQEMHQDYGLKKTHYLKRHGLPVKRLLPLKTPIQRKCPNEFRLGWFGGLTHAVFASYYENILTILAQTNIPIKFICFGKPKEFEERIQRLSNIQVENYPLVPFANETAYYTLIANLACNAVINYLPDTKALNGKTELKYLETGLYQYPLISSKVGIYGEVIRHGVNGMLVSNPKETVKAVQFLQQNFGKRAEMASAAHRDVVENYSIEKKTREFEATLFKLFIVNRAMHNISQYGRFIKSETQPTVYLQAFGCKHVIPTSQVFRSLNGVWTKVVILPDHEVKQIQDGYILDVKEEDFL